jgi:UDP-N-acetylmuramoyl-tripeptide--D-alanyl-D-alanine ligase
MGKNLWKGDEVVTAINGSGPSNWTASGVSIDTRSLKKGDIFFALSGPNYDGRQFISSAIKKGASVVVSNTPSIELNDKIIIVNDVLSALIALGRASRERNKGKIIAITGSSGKTTVKEMLALSLRKFGKLHYSEASYNNKIGVSLSLARMPSDSDFSIYELGMNHPGEIN